MTNYLNLVKVLYKSNKMSSSNSLNKKILLKTLLFFVVIFIIIPFILTCGFLVGVVTHKLLEIDYETIGLEVMCFVTLLFTFVFSLSVVINELYFSNDVERLLPLPLKPVEIVMAKFTTAYIKENFMQIGIIAASSIGFLLVVKESLLNFVLSLVGILTLPIIPTIYCCIISMFLMAFTRRIKNKETVKQISVIIVFIIFLVFTLLIGSLQNVNFEEYIMKFAEGDHRFLYVMEAIFPHVKSFVLTLYNASIIEFIKYILINALFILGFIFISNKLYFKGLVDLNTKDTKSKKSKKSLKDSITIHSPKTSYVLKEVKTLLRTPPLFINCIIVNIIWPLLVYFMYKLAVKDGTMKDISIKLSNWDQKTVVTYLVVFLTISILVPSIASIASSSFSREGKHFSFMKYIPMSIEDQWFVKVFTAFIISFIGINMYQIPYFIFMKLPIFLGLVLFILSTLIIIFMSLLGVYIDSIQPKLIWDDELNALRENTNNFLVAGLSLLLLFVLCLVSYKMYTMNINVMYICLTELGIIVVLNIVMIIITKIYGYKNIMSQEEA